MAKTKRAPPAPLEKFSKHFSSPSQWGDRWEALYAAMLKPTRYVTLRNRFANEQDFKSIMQGLVLEQVHLPPRIDFQGLNCFISTSSQDELRPYPEPSLSSNGVNTHWNLDIASLLAVSILDVKPGDKVLDLCAAPGGKSVALAQSIFNTDHPAQEQASTGCLHSNEYNMDRMRRLTENLQQYLPDAYNAKFVCSHRDGTEANLVFPCGVSGYDKVLLDAPCSSERHIVHAQDRVSRSGAGKTAEELSRWSPGLAKRLAEVQVKLLQNALRAVKPGGRVLYATCSISKEENDEVVKTVLHWTRQQYDKKAWSSLVQLDNLKEDFHAALDLWAERTTTGWIVLPDKETPYGSGWGPLFFSVLTKHKL